MVSLACVPPSHLPILPSDPPSYTPTNNTYKVAMMDIYADTSVLSQVCSSTVKYIENLSAYYFFPPYDFILSHPPVFFSGSTNNKIKAIIDKE